MDRQPLDGTDALARLLEGNERFVLGEMRTERHVGSRRAELVEGQSPFAVVLSCADSRVPSEIVFDQGLGDIFVVRVAGNTAAEPVVRGSIEFAVEVVGTVLLMVLGHEGCGAVTAALDQLERASPLAGEIQAIVDPVLPAAREVAGPDRVDLAVRANVRRQVDLLLERSAVLSAAARSGRLTVVGAEYRLATGRVEVVCCSESYS